MKPDRLLGRDPATRALAGELLDTIADDPLICPHGHVDPALLSDPAARFPDPVALFIRPDHYLLRMLYSQGVPLQKLLEGETRQVWRLFAANYPLFWGTPSGLWLDYQLQITFGLKGELNEQNADRLYDELCHKLAGDDYTPRRLFERFGIEVLCTTDEAIDPLEHHRRIAADSWSGRVLPTFRPDRLLQVRNPHWMTQLDELRQLENTEIVNLSQFLEALRSRRLAFKELGCTATDHGHQSAHTERLTPHDAAMLFEKALAGTIDHDEAERLHGHLLLEMAAMSLEDGLVMQLHVGSLRNHNGPLFEFFGPDRGADIPLATEYTRALQPLLETFGNEPGFRVIVFTLDESTYSRELAPLAGHYPAMLLGPPWWFHDSPNGMMRYFEQVLETAGLFNTAGFNDDTRAFCSISARHDLWRRVSCRWLAEMVQDGRLSLTQAQRLAPEMAGGLARRAYNL